VREHNGKVHGTHRRRVDGTGGKRSSEVGKVSWVASALPKSKGAADLRRRSAYSMGLHGPPEPDENTPVVR